MWAAFNHFVLRMTREEARQADHQGACDADVAYLLTTPSIRRQLNRICPAAIRAELKEYGAWSAEELADDEQNRARIVWVAAGNINEEAVMRGRKG